MKTESPTQSLVISQSELALSIYQALTPLQIQQTVLDRDRNNRWLLEHPVKGMVEISADTLVAEAVKPFRIAGIGVELNKTGSPIVLDHGGVWDPLTGAVVGDHYATSHFAWLASILKTDPKWREQITAALTFHERTHRRYPFSKQEPHWEFNNLAWMEIWFQIKEHMPDLSERLRSVLLSASWHPRPYGTNWKLMLAAFLLLRHKAFGRFPDRILGLLYLKWGLSMQDRDGCLLDVPRHGSRSLQYHAYSTALLFRMHDLDLVSADVESKAILAANWLLAHSAPNGDCVWRGRGQGQLFGYAASSYVFRSATQRRPPNEASFRRAHDSLLAFISEHHRGDGLMPLVLNGFPDAAHVGWYDYNHVTVYNAFAGVWFALPPQTVADESHSAQWEMPRVVFFDDSRVLIVQTEQLFFSISGGELAYPAEAGMTLQMFFFKGIGSVIRGAAGPGQGPYGSKYSLPQEHYNLTTPFVVKDDGSLIGPAGKRYQVRYENSKVNVTGDYGGIRLSRVIDWSGRNGTVMIIEDTIQAIASEYVTIHPVNLPLQAHEKTRLYVDFSRIVMQTDDIGFAVNLQIDSQPISIMLGEVEPQTLGLSRRVTSQNIVIHREKPRTVSQQWKIVH